MQAGIITIGDEILLGQVVDTNSAWIGQQLADVGIDVIQKWSVGDNLDIIKNTLSAAVNICDVLLITGGLGPTKDDITKVAIAQFLGVQMYFDASTYDRIVAIFTKLYKPLSESHRTQCMMPEGVELLANTQGTAPGMLFYFNNTQIISMPGVPMEMKAIMTQEVLPRLSNQSNLEIKYKTIQTACTSETVIEDALRSYLDTLPETVSIAYLPALAQVRLRITTKYDKGTDTGVDVQSISAEIVRILGEKVVFGYDNDSLQSVVKHMCLSRKLTVSTAESCTGGGLTAKIVSEEGSSDYFLGGIVSYSNTIKTEVLGVTEEIISNFGAVSQETVASMVKGILSVMKSDIGVAISGIAGPSGGSEDKPVGTIWIAIGNQTTLKSYKIIGYKDRIKNIDYAVIFALNYLRLFILEQYPNG
ncbi:MAG: competence/damage-inducible protein A [Saprospiraceae bacterium]